MDYTVGTDIICVWAQSDGRGGGRQLWLYTPSVLPCVWHAQNWQKKKKKKKRGGEYLNESYKSYLPQF